MANGQLIPFQAPNFAQTFLSLKAQESAASVQEANAATQQIRAQAEIANARLKASEANRAREEVKRVFALNLLSGVNSEDSLTQAKTIFKSRFPDEDGASIDQMLPAYDPERIRLVRNALLTPEQRFGAQVVAPGASVFRQRDVALEEGPVAPAATVPTKPPAPKFELFELDGNQFWVEEGKDVPEGAKRVEKPTARGVTIQTGPQVGKTTRTKLEGDIIEGVRNIQSFGETRKLFKPEYLTWWGRGKKTLAENMDKAGISTEDQKKLITERNKWFRQAKADFIAYRKWATGVAGGEKELAEIATSFPDPVKNSPTQYMANLDNIEETTKRVLMLNAEFLRSGINVDQPLSAILAQMEASGSTIAPPPTPSGPSTTDLVFQFDAQGNLIQ